MRADRTTKALGAADTAAHRSLDWYINRTLPGWGRLQLWQWHLCNAYERHIDNITQPPAREETAHE